MTVLRLLADDLTGALDTAAEFIPLVGSMPVFWPNGNRLHLAASAALDSGTRECESAAAMAQIGGLVRLLEGADIAFKKIDSLLRGPSIAEIAACMHAGIWRYCALAPAFPYQGRVTRKCRQYVRSAGGWTAVGDHLVDALRSFGVLARTGRADADLQPGVSVFDAETDADLRRVVATVRRCGEPVLWAGTGGLAQAITAGHDPAVAACPATPGHIPRRHLNGAHGHAGATGDNAAGPLPQPILGVFGSDQPATAEQLAACQPHWMEIEDEASHAIRGRLDDTGLVLVSFHLPLCTPRAPAAERIAAAIVRLVNRIDPPGTVIVAGGETLRRLCEAVDAASLEVQGRMVPGVPRSVIRGGRWNGVTVVSKSGAFGHPHLLRQLIPREVGSAPIVAGMRKNKKPRTAE